MENEKIFYDKKIFKNGKDAPLKNATLITTGAVKSINKRKNADGKTYLSLDVECIIGDKFVKETFGEDYVNPEHKVLFQFTLNGWRAEEFEKYPPRWGQNHIFMLTNMEPKTYKRKDGNTMYFISCFGDMMSVGSVKKPVGIIGKDGSNITFDENTRFAYAERPAMKIFSQEGKTSAEPATQTPQFEEIDLFDLDEDDPF